VLLICFEKNKFTRTNYYTESEYYRVVRCSADTGYQMDNRYIPNIFISISTLYLLYDVNKHMCNFNVDKISIITRPTICNMIHMFYCPTNFWGTWLAIFK